MANKVLVAAEYFWLDLMTGRQLESAKRALVDEVGWVAKLLHKMELVDRSSSNIPIRDFDNATP
jgi:hypothetical protein